MEAIDYGIVAGVVAAVMGAVKGIEAYAKQRAAQKRDEEQRAAGFAQPEVTGVTDVQRPVMQADCKQTHSELSGKLEAVNDKVGTLNVTLVRLEGKFDAWAARSPGDMHAIARKEVREHEQRMHKVRTPSDSQ